MSGKLQKHPKLLSFMSKDIALRAFLVAVVLGSVLTLTNQSGAVFGGDALQVIPLILVYLTPVSQLLGVRRAMLDELSGHAASRNDGSFVVTALSHGIPLRALFVASVIGTANTLIVAISALMSNGALANLPAALIAQAFALPMLFGLLSQTISYRRAASAIGRQMPPAPHPLST